VVWPLSTGTNCMKLDKFIRGKFKEFLHLNKTIKQLSVP
jgi:hypothetical protein